MIGYSINTLYNETLGPTGFRSPWKPRNGCLYTVDRELLMLKIICVKNFCVVKFSRFRSIREILLTVGDYNMDKRLESSWRLVYYRVSGEPGIAGCSRQSNIYPVDLHAQAYPLIVAM